MPFHGRRSLSLARRGRGLRDPQPCGRYCRAAMPSTTSPRTSSWYRLSMRYNFDASYVSAVVPKLKAKYLDAAA